MFFIRRMLSIYYIYICFVFPLSSLAKPTFFIRNLLFDSFIASTGGAPMRRNSSTMMSYCPMHNVQKGAKYPSMLLTAGLHDPRVQYWEPTKFAATIRHTASDDTIVALKVDMTAGHFSASDRYKYLKELAFDYAFLLSQLGIVEGTD